MLGAWLGGDGSRCAWCQPVLSLALRQLQEQSAAKFTDPLDVKEAKSATCRVLGLQQGCCLTLTLFFPPFMILLAGLIRYRPGFALVSMAVLPPTCFFLMWLMALEYLSCVIAWFTFTTLQLFITTGYLARRRIKYGPNFLTKSQAEIDADARALNALHGIVDGITSLASLGAAIRAQEAAPRRESSARESERDPAERAPGGSSPAMKVNIAGLREALQERWEDMQAMREEAAHRKSYANRVDPSDAADPHNWATTQLATYLQSREGAAVAPDAARFFGAASRDELVRRVCAAMGRRHYPAGTGSPRPTATPPSESPARGSGRRTGHAPGARPGYPVPVSEPTSPSISSDSPSISPRSRPPRERAAPRSLFIDDAEAELFARLTRGRRRAEPPSPRLRRRLRLRLRLRLASASALDLLKT